MTLTGLNEVQGPNYLALQGQLSVTREGGGEPLVMTPELRSFTNPPMQTTQAAIDTVWDGQLYLVLGDQTADGRWLLRLWWKPFITLIWLGGAMIALGGGLSLLGRLGGRHAAGRQPAPGALPAPISKVQVAA